MSSSAIKLEPRAIEVRVTADTLHVRLAYGRELAVPVAWFPRLQQAPLAARNQYRLIGGGIGISCPHIDEDISVEGLLATHQHISVGAPAAQRALQLTSEPKDGGIPTEHAMYFGPPIDDPAILAFLPAELVDLLRRANGYVAYHGGLHVRGACHAPEWHSLRAAWSGPRAIHRLFPAVRADDVPFGEDALGHQFVLRDRTVHRLDSEIGELESLEVDLADFDAHVRADPLNYLRLQPLERFRADGGSLQPGQLLSVYPPYVFEESAESVSLRAISAGDRLGFLADLAAAIRDVPDGSRVALPPLPP